VYEQLKKQKKIKAKQKKIKSNQKNKYYVIFNIQTLSQSKFIKWHAKDINLNKIEIFKNIILIFEDKFYQIFEEDVVKGNVAVIRKSGDGEFEDMEMNMHFVNKKIKYVWDANLQVSINLLV
jgi:hypothetical protein